MNKRWPTGIALAAVAWYASDSLRHRREQRQGYELRGGELEIGSQEFLRATEAITMAPITHGNDIELFINGDEIFPAMIETMRGAQRSLNFLTYLYWSGEIATEIASTLCQRAKAGVEVNVLLDAVGSARMDRALISDMNDAGVTFAFFRPPKPYAVRRLNNRTHRKLLIADGAVGMTGGVGIADQWTGNAQDPHHWRDTHVRVRGPIVRGLQARSPRTGSRPPATCSSGPRTCRSSSRYPTTGRCRPSGRPRRSATRTSRRSTSWRSPARGRACG
ncbi:MAG TPA: phospholipase D-like domain-containing protein [Solirubrobacteraceae bacterium]